jgi:hypothetical protein
MSLLAKLFAKPLVIEIYTQREYGEIKFWNAILLIGFTRFS